MNFSSLKDRLWCLRINRGIDVAFNSWLLPNAEFTVEKNHLRPASCDQEIQMLNRSSSQDSNRDTKNANVEKGSWLITGGAGYIGSHVVRGFSEQGLKVIVLDNLSNGIRQRVPSEVPFIQGDCSDTSLLRGVFDQHGVIGVVHLAGFKHARESAKNAVSYWSNNVGAMLGLINAIKDSNVRYFLLSSSCSIFGSSGLVDIEKEPKPQSPYAKTKLSSEQILADCSEELRLSWVVLRYFNVIGNGDFPHAHDTSHQCIVPASYARIKKGTPPVVFGTDFATIDGTALRDYVDVRDLASAHFKAVQYMAESDAGVHLGLSIGTGSPTSVSQVIRTLFDSMDETMEVDEQERHPADPDAVWADNSLAKELLSWVPHYDLKASIESHVASVQRTIDQ